MNDKDLYWQNEKTPASRRHDDIYFSASDGLRESRHVFLDGINAPEIWRDKARFTLLENGFGAGLNFVMTCLAWRDTAPPDSRLTYIATEKYPLAAHDMARALSGWPELRDLGRDLLAILPPAVPGFHRREMPGGRITLLLLYGDSADSLSRLEATVDAIYLDGFAPRRNPDMWRGEIFTELARLAAPGAALATFTAAGAVRRGLDAVGFHMRKSKGFDRKRDQLSGIFNGNARGAAPCPDPWYHLPTPLPPGRRIAVIGGGIAGLTTGRALMRQGYEVEIFDRDARPMTRASGNPAGILDPFLTTDDSAEGDFYRAALIHALHFYHDLDPNILIHKGLIKQPVNDAERRKFARLLAQAALPPDLMRPAADGGLCFPRCGAISPSRIRQRLAERLAVTGGVRISRIEREHSWVLYDDQDNARHAADAVVICGGAASTAFHQTRELPLDPVRGQISLFDAGEISPLPKNVLCGKGYLIPPINLDGRPTLVAGATFGRKDRSLDLRAEDHQENLANAVRLWPALSDACGVIGGRAALRAYSPDRLPLCGPVPDHAAFKEAYQDLRHGPRHKVFAAAPYQENLFMLTGLGARGFLTAPLLAENLAAQIAGAASPLPRHIRQSLHPARFLIRALARGK